MAERIRERGPSGASGWLASAIRLILAFRAAMLVVTMLFLPAATRKDLVAAAIVCAAVASYAPLRHWDRVGPILVRHPAYLAAELVLSAVILLLCGVESPFFYYTLGTALLGGLVYGWPGAALFSAMLLGIYAWVFDVRMDIDGLQWTFQTAVGLPVLYPIVASAGAGARRLLDGQALAESQLAEQERRTAAEEERARLARDMHDSLAKTVHGIGFAALGLARRIEIDPEGAADAARQLAEDARQAAIEARELVRGLRGRDDGELPLPTLLRVEAQRWSSATGVPVRLALDDVPRPATLAVRELRGILKEALANVERHARAGEVVVGLRGFGDRVVLTVRDDGAGFAAPDDADELEAAGHYGLVGMRERARLAGGDLSVEAEPDEGCVISAWVPAAAAPGPPASASPGTVPDPAAPAPPGLGVTWR